MHAEPLGLRGAQVGNLCPTGFVFAGLMTGPFKYNCQIVQNEVLTKKINLLSNAMIKVSKATS